MPTEIPFPQQDTPTFSSSTWMVSFAQLISTRGNISSLIAANTPQKPSRKILIPFLAPVGL
jgi:hypothetical protein